MKRSTEAGLRSIPIFVISFNRGSFLETVIASYRRQDRPVEIVVHDNGSDDPATLWTLDALAAAGTRVYRYGRITMPDELDGVDDSVRRHAAETGYRGPYAVTDCDVDLSGARPDALATYLAMLEAFPDTGCVGPMLTIADIPRSYPLFNRVMERHISQFWHREPDWTILAGRRVAYLAHRIDTSFAMHRGGAPFRRLKPGLRLYHPYEARHLDWYATADGADADAYRQTSAPAISHWNNAAGFERHGAHPGTERTYRIVAGEPGDLRIVERRTTDNPP